MKIVRIGNASTAVASRDDQGPSVVEATLPQDNVSGTHHGTAAHESGQARVTRRMTELPAIEPARGNFRRTIRRAELRRIVPLSDSTIYEMERNGDFPRRFHLTARCVVWDLHEVEAWVDMRRNASIARGGNAAHFPDVRQRKLRPVKKDGSPQSRD